KTRIDETTIKAPCQTIAAQPNVLPNNKYSFLLVNSPRCTAASYDADAHSAMTVQKSCPSHSDLLISSRTRPRYLSLALSKGNRAIGASKGTATLKSSHARNRL